MKYLRAFALSLAVSFAAASAFATSALADDIFTGDAGSGTIVGPGSDDLVNTCSFCFVLGS